MSRDLKADVSLLNKLVSELSVQLDFAYKIRDSMRAEHTDEKYQTFIVEMSKSVGILSGIASEAAMLVSDLQKIIQSTSPLPEDETNDILKTFMKAAGKGSARN